jgi:antitoxin component of MazEF toxin-antitoxin module
METTVIKIGNSLGLRVPEAIVKDFNLRAGAKIKMNFKKNGELTLRKKSKVREGWDRAFAMYVLNGEEKMLLPDFIDSEANALL